MNSTPKHSSADMAELNLNLSDSFTEDIEDVTPLNSTSTMDELMSALDLLEGHADDSIQASRKSELYWIQTLNERDELILANNKSIEDLSRLNVKLKEENELLKHQLVNSDKSEIMSALQESAGDSIKLSAELHSELEQLQGNTVSKLKQQNTQLQQRLVKSGESYREIFTKLRQERARQNSGILRLREDLQGKGKQIHSDEDQQRVRAQLEELCDIYDTIIKGACEECEDFLHSIDSMQTQPDSVTAASPQQNHPGSRVDKDKYYTELLQVSEKSNHDLRQQIEKLNMELNAKEQQMFGDTIARLENTNRDQMEKLKSQIAELSQELSLLNVDNRALRERVLKTENENEVLSKQMNETSTVGDELRSLQSNLDNQLAMNHASESKIKELELIRAEHITLCHRVKVDLAEASGKVSQYEAEIIELREKVREAKGMQEQFDHMNRNLNNRMELLQNENSVLMDQVSTVHEEAHAAQQSRMEVNHVHSHQLQHIKEHEEARNRYEQEIRELSGRLETTEQQRQHANMKVQALRERLKSMQDSWQKISVDTESSFTGLRDQYQQQIKEYKSIVESLKSQNASLGARIDSMKRVSAQSSTNTSGKVNNLEHQISEYQQMTDGYREENILLRKELRGIIVGLQEEEKEQGFKTKFTQRDEFARLRDILNTARSECENLTQNKTPRNRTSTVEKDISLGDVSKSLSSSQRASSTRDLLYRYEKLSPESSTQKLSSAAAPQRASEKAKYKQTTTWNKTKVVNEDRHPPQAVASSTPRASKSANLSNYKPRQDFKRLSTSADRLDNIKRNSYDPSKLSTSTVEDMIKHKSSQKAKYDTEDNTKMDSRKDNITPQRRSSASELTRPVKVITPPQSSTKNVVEIKHRNSVELDPSKSFIPINPDNGGFASTPAASSSVTSITKSMPYQPISAYKPTFLSSEHRVPYISGAYKSSYQPTYQPRTASYDSINRKYERSTNHIRPYQSKYEPTSKSHYDESVARPSYDYKNASVDSAYSSPTRSFSSKQPSIASYSGSVYRHDPLPSFPTLSCKYSSTGSINSRGNDSMAKQPDYKSSTTAMINRTLDDLEDSIETASLIANSDRRLTRYKGHLNKTSPATKYENVASSRYTIPYSRVNISSDENVTTDRSYRRPTTVNFTGTAILYDSKY